MDPKRIEELEGMKAFAPESGNSPSCTSSISERRNPKKDRSARRPRPDWSQDDRVTSCYGTRIMTGHPATKVGYYKRASGETGPRTGGKKKGSLRRAQAEGCRAKLGLIRKGKGKNGRSFTAEQLKRVERGAAQ